MPPGGGNSAGVRYSKYMDSAPTTRSKTMTRETASQAFTRNHAEALDLARALVAKLEAASPEGKHWGHVGDMNECVSNLRGAAHWAGVPGASDED